MIFEGLPCYVIHAQNLFRSSKMAIEKSFLIPIDAPRDEIWRYFMEEESMKKWLANDIHLDLSLIHI